ncbi:MAG: LamG domain-containing protein [Sandaracinaceae bacterium]
MGIDAGARDGGATDAGGPSPDAGPDAGVGLDGGHDGGGSDSGTDAGEPSARFALAFDGDGDDIQFPVSIGDLGTQFTFELWVRPTSASAAGIDGAIVFSHRADCTDIDIEWSGSEASLLPQRFRFRVYPDSSCSWVVAEDPGTSVVGEWHHVAGVFEDGDLRLYVDGSLVASATQPLAISWTTGLLGHWAGRDGPDSRPTRGGFIGEMDEIRISRSARYSGPTITPPTHFAIDADTVALWLLDEGTGTMAIDQSAAGFDGLIRNASWVPSTR